MADSILDSVKKNLGIGADYDVFDTDIMTHINTVFMNLYQIGIGPATGFMIEDSEPTWDTYLGTTPLLNGVKSYMYLKVKLLFDPPAYSFVLTSMEKQIAELEWRLLVMRDEMVSSLPIVEVVTLDSSGNVGGGGQV